MTAKYRCSYVPSERVPARTILELDSACPHYWILGVVLREMYLSS